MTYHYFPWSNPNLYVISNRLEDFHAFYGFKLGDVQPKHILGIIT